MTCTRYVVLAGFCMAATVAYVERNGIGVAVGRIKQDLVVSDKQMGFVMGAFFLSYALLQIPGGWLAIRYGTRRMLTIYALLWSLATAMIGTATGFWTLLAAQLAMGAAQASLFPCATSSLARWLPGSQRGLASGALASFMSVGSATGIALAGVLLARLGWRPVFVLYAIPGLLWAAWFAWYFRDRPEEHPSMTGEELWIIRGGHDLAPPTSPTTAREPTPWPEILSRWAMWCICGQHVLRAAGYVFYGSWFPQFLRTTRGVSEVESGWLASWPLAAVIVGSLTGGMFSDRLVAATGSRRIGRQTLAALSMLACAALILVSLQLDDVQAAVAVITAGSFCAAFGGPCAYAITMDMGGRHVSAVFSVMNSAGSLGAFLFPSIIPYIVQWSGNWQAVIYVFSGIYLAAAVCWVSFDPSGTMDRREPHGLAAA
jgi:MFS family permease